MKYEAKISEDLVGMATDVMALKPHPKNIRKHNLEAIKHSLQKYGQMKPIVVQKSTGYIIAGNGTWSAATSLGWDTMAASFVDCDDHTALGFLIADNKASDLSAYDTAKLKDALSLLADGPGLFDTLWTMDEYEDLLAQDPAATMTAREEFRGTYAETPEELAQRMSGSGTKSDGSPRVSMKEMPLLIRAEDHAAFIKRLRTLGQHFGETSVLGIIFALVDYAEKNLLPEQEAASE
jgi:hypothetical protein